MTLNHGTAKINDEPPVNDARRKTATTTAQVAPNLPPVNDARKTATTSGDASNIPTNSLKNAEADTPTQTHQDEDADIVMTDLTNDDGGGSGGPMHVDNDGAENVRLLIDGKMVVAEAASDLQASGPNPASESSRRSARLLTLTNSPHNVQTTRSNNGSRSKPKKRNTRGPAQVNKNAQPVRDDIIDVDRWSPKPVTLDVSKQLDKVLGKEICAYGPNGEVTCFQPVSHVSCSCI